mgnify:CR=1 FL=1
MENLVENISKSVTIELLFEELHDFEVITKFQISSEYIKLQGITWSILMSSYLNTSPV